MVTAYYYIVWRIWIYRCLNGDEEAYRLYWPSVFIFPDVVSVKDLEKKNK